MKVWTPESRPEWQPQMGEAEKAVRRFGREQAAIGSALVGLSAQGLTNVVPEVWRPSVESVRDWGLGKYQENIAATQEPRLAPAVPSYQDIKIYGKAD